MFDESEENISADNSGIYSSESETDDSGTDIIMPRWQYPQRERRACRLPDNIPWDAIRI